MENFFDEFFERVERLFRRMRRLVEEDLLEDAEERCIRPLTHVYYSGEDIIVMVDLPLADPSSVRVDLVNPRALFIEARIKRSIPSDLIDLNLPPVEFNRFRTTVHLPRPASRVTSIKMYRDVLEIRLKAR